MEMSHFDLIFSCEKKPAFNPTKSNDWFFGVKCFFSYSYSLPKTRSTPTKRAFRIGK